MNIAKQDVALALRVAETKNQELQIHFDQADIDAYKASLQDIAKKNPYPEGERLSDDDFEIVSNGIRTMLKGMRKNFFTLPDDVRSQANVAEMLMAANDYLLAVAMDELNSPNIPNTNMEEFTNVYQGIASSMIDNKPTKLYLTDKIHKEQRGINADKLKSGKVGQMMNDLRDGSTNIEDYADLYAEYQALAKRQENHGAIWRFFHRKENDARTAMLDEMKELLLEKLSQHDLEDLNKDPALIIKEAERSTVNLAIYAGIFNREMHPERSFEYFKYKNDQGQQLSDPSKNSKTTSAVSESAAVNTEENKTAEIDTVTENTDKELGTAKTKVYLPELSEVAGSVDKSNKIDEKTISAPSAEIKQ